MQDITSILPPISLQNDAGARHLGKRSPGILTTGLFASKVAKLGALKTLTVGKLAAKKAKFLKAAKGFKFFVGR